MKANYIGRYNILGYEVFNLAASVSVYTAGNSPHDSMVVCSPEEGLPLETIREYCEQTTREIAEENNGTFGGIEYDDTPRETA